jgi:GWxTD domain-containing protein
MQRCEIYAVESSAVGNDTSFLGGIFSFFLPAGEYSLAFEVDDLESGKRYREESKKVLVRNFSASVPVLSDVVFLEEAASVRPNTLTPFNFGGDIPLGRHSMGYFQVVVDHSSSLLRAKFNIFRMPTETQENIPVVRDSIQASSFSPAKKIAIERQEDHYLYIQSDTVIPNVLSCFFNMPIDTLAVGNYILEISLQAGDSARTVRQPFHIRWIGMPHSLRKLEFAIGAMEYVMTEEEFRHLKSASAQSQRKLFEEFWKKRDPTPLTAYNEAMAEYFKRVDYSAISFTTVKEENGVKSDRGKTYILYGPPTKIERTLPPSSYPQEVWYYAKLGKKLIFIDESRTGEYKLETSEHF